MSGLSLGTCLSNLKSVALTVLELLARLLSSTRYIVFLLMTDDELSQTNVTRPAVSKKHQESLESL